jgi:hypothetical protein
MQQEFPLAAPVPPENQALLVRVMRDVVVEYAEGKPMKRKHLFAMVHRTAAALVKNLDPDAPAPVWSDSQCRTAFKIVSQEGEAVGSTRRGYMAIATWQNAADAIEEKVSLMNDCKDSIRLIVANTRRKLGPPPAGFTLQQEFALFVTPPPAEGVTP